jgi:hybrid cluster-associated redox disulfide protein
MISKDMSVEDIVKRHPTTILVFERYGLGCAGCRAALFETVTQGAAIHGIDVDALVADLNAVISKG